MTPVLADFRVVQTIAQILRRAVDLYRPWLFEDNEGELVGVPDISM